MNHYEAVLFQNVCEKNCAREIHIMKLKNGGGWKYDFPFQWGDF